MVRLKTTCKFLVLWVCQKFWKLTAVFSSYGGRRASPSILAAFCQAALQRMAMEAMASALGRGGVARSGNTYILKYVYIMDIYLYIYIYIYDRERFQGCLNAICGMASRRSF